MPVIEPMMRAMMHLSIGTAIAMFIWILWSGQQILRGDVSAVVRHTFTMQSDTQQPVQTPASQTQLEATP